MTQRQRLSILMDSTAFAGVERELLVSTTKRHDVTVSPVTVLGLLARLSTTTDKRAAFASLLNAQHAVVRDDVISAPMLLLKTTAPTTHRYFLGREFCTKILRIAASSGDHDDFMSRSFVIHDAPVTIAELPSVALAVLQPLQATVLDQIRALRDTVSRDLSRDDVAALDDAGLVRFVVAAVFAIADTRKAQLTAPQLAAVYFFVASSLVRAQQQIARGADGIDRAIVEATLLLLHASPAAETVVVSADDDTRAVIGRTAGLVTALVKRAPLVRAAPLLSLRGNGPVSPR